MESWQLEIDRWLEEMHERPNGHVLPDDVARLRMPHILRGLVCDREETRLQSLFLIPTMGHPGREAEPLLFVLVDDDDDDVRESALEALLALRPDCPDRLRFVARFMWDRWSGVPAMLKHYVRDLRPLLDTILAQCAHPKPFARIWAGRLLVREELAGPRTRAHLQALLGDDDRWVCAEVREAARDVPGLDIPWMDGDLDLPWAPDED